MAFSTTPSEGNDRLRATADDQTIRALGGSDWLRSTFDASTLYGGDGHDRLSVALDLVEPTVDDFTRSSTLFGGNGNDWLVSDFSVSSTDQAPEFSFNFTSRQSGGSGNDNIFISALGEGDYYPIGTFFFEVFGGFGEDNIWIEVVGTGVSNNNYVNSGTGADIVYISFEAGPDWGGGINEVYAGADDDDVIVAGSAGWMDGGNENSIWGEDGNDRLEAMTGASGGFNRLFGGTGDDTLIATGNVGGDPGNNLRNSAWGGDGNDTIDLSGTGRALFNDITHVAYGDIGNDIITSITDGSSVGNEGTSSADTLLDGGAGEDVLTATTIFGAGDEAEGGARLYGRAGNDTLRVYGGIENVLDGGAGNDTITGGSGNDIITGGAGADVLRGGGREDAFIYAWMTGVDPATRDTIRGFVSGDDVIDLSAIDANTNLRGNQSFGFAGTNNAGLNFIWVEEDPETDGSLVRGNNGGAEQLYIAVADGAGRDADDWRPDDFLL